MKRGILLFAAILVAGCGEKSSSEGSAKPSLAGTWFALEPQSEAPSDTPNSLSDADIERLLKGAVDVDEPLEERGDLLYQDNKPYSGWIKGMYDSGKVELLGQAKDGKPDGLWTSWHENGQKVKEGMMKDGKEHGLYTEWHENGQKRTEVTFKDGEPVSATKHWNSKGEEVDTSEEAFE